MKVNDIFRKGDVYLRVLAIKDDYCFCINCNGKSMPVWIPINTLEEYTLDTELIIDITMTARQKQIARERFTMIAPLLALRQKYRCKRSHHAGAPPGASFFVCMVEKFTGACYTYKVIG